MAGERRRGFAFGDFRLYPEEALLLRFGRPLPLPPKSFHILCILVENHGHLVEKQDLIKAVWPDTHVVENNLRYSISLLRKALSDDSGAQEFIQTFPTRGYKFVGELQEIEIPGNGGGLITAIEQTGSGRGATAENDEAAKPHSASTSKSFLIRLAFGISAALLVISGFLLVRVLNLPPMQARSAAISTSRQAVLSRNPEANDYFERGVHSLERRSVTSGSSGTEALEHAVAIDPTFALAYAHLAVAYIMQGSPGLAAGAARRALALNPLLPETHAALGFIATYRDWDWKTAESELRRSVELDPAYARGHQWLANLYEILGRLPEAREEMEAALKLDPQSPLINNDLAKVLLEQQDFDATISQCNKTLALDPDFLSTFDALEAAYLAQRKYDMAADAAIRLALKSATDSRYPEQMRGAFHTSGIAGLLQVELQNQLNSANVSGYLIAQSQIRLGKNEEALQTLLRAFHSHDFFVPYAGSNPEFIPLRSDPRFQEMLRHMGLATEAAGYQLPASQHGHG